MDHKLVPLVGKKSREDILFQGTRNNRIIRPRPSKKLKKVVSFPDLENCCLSPGSGEGTPPFNKWKEKMGSKLFNDSEDDQLMEYAFRESLRTAELELQKQNLSSQKSKWEEKYSFKGKPRSTSLGAESIDFQKSNEDWDVKDPLKFKSTESKEKQSSHKSKLPLEEEEEEEDWDHAPQFNSRERRTKSFTQENLVEKYWEIKSHNYSKKSHSKMNQKHANNIINQEIDSSSPKNRIQLIDKEEPEEEKKQLFSTNSVNNEKTQKKLIVPDFISSSEPSPYTDGDDDLNVFKPKDIPKYKWAALTTRSNFPNGVSTASQSSPNLNSNNKHSREGISLNVSPISAASEAQTSKSSFDNNSDSVAHIVEETLHRFFQTELQKLNNHGNLSTNGNEASSNGTLSVQQKSDLEKKLFEIPLPKLMQPLTDNAILESSSNPVEMNFNLLSECSQTKKNDYGCKGEPKGYGSAAPEETNLEDLQTIECLNLKILKLEKELKRQNLLLENVNSSSNKSTTSSSTCDSVEKIQNDQSENIDFGKQLETSNVKNVSSSFIAEQNLLNSSYAPVPQFLSHPVVYPVPNLPGMYYNSSIPWPPNPAGYFTGIPPFGTSWNN